MDLMQEDVLIPEVSVLLSLNDIRSNSVNRSRSLIVVAIAVAVDL